MRVYIEQTQQKSILKFVCDELITPGSIEFSSEDDLSSSQLAQQLFLFPFVQRVFITANFVAVQKSSAVEWEDVAQELKEIINSHLEAQTIVLKEKKIEPFSLYAEMTPNPRVMKFVSNQLITDSALEVKSVDEADNVPLARELFTHFDFIQEIFIDDNYLSITRKLRTDWQFTALEVREFILNYLQAGKKVFLKDNLDSDNSDSQSNDLRRFTVKEMEIQRILDEYVQPAVAKDGGKISLVKLDEGSKTATMLMQGACSGCPSSTLTLKNGIESLLKEMMPGIVEHVQAENA
ncbi:MAG: NifU family protein [Flavobacteriaceae bacterium]|nr:NifU family protein [Flavobacteriaceae bacterium]